ncbi:MAG: hypothetical protein HY907_00205 [Deltaproteobacteria bacterium]|nr:hypothetical protein [Deltaproteobacteria bacterium]
MKNLALLTILSSLLAACGGEAASRCNAETCLARCRMLDYLGGTCDGNACRCVGLAGPDADADADADADTGPEDRGAEDASVPDGWLCPPPDPLEGDYFEFSWFVVPGSMYCDAGSYLDEVYVHDMFTPREVDVYKVLVDVPDKADEVPFLEGPDGVYGTADDPPNPEFQERTLTLDRTIQLVGGPNPNAATNSEMHIDSSGIYLLGGTGWYPGIFGDDVLHFNFDGSYVGKAVDSEMSGMVDGCCLGYDSVNEVWYLLSMSRGVYSSAGGDWMLEFAYPDMAGDHGDGLEVAVGPEGEIFVYVSDMTSNYIGQWSRSDNPCTAAVETEWNEWNRFSYKELGGSRAKLVEGMGLGALGHFWVTSGDGDGALTDAVIYELGGGRIGQYLPPLL